MDMFILYIIFQLNSIKALFFILAAISFIVSMVGFVNVIDYNTKLEIHNIIKKWFRYTTIIFIITSLLLVLTPSTKTILTIYGVDTIYDFIKNNKEIKVLPDKIIRLIDKELDNILKDKE